MRQEWSSTKAQFIEPAIKEMYKGVKYSDTFSRQQILSGSYGHAFQLAMFAIADAEEANSAASSGFQELGTKRRRSHDSM